MNMFIPIICNWVQNCINHQPQWLNVWLSAHMVHKLNYLLLQKPQVEFLYGGPTWSFKLQPWSKHTSPKQVIIVIGKRLSITNVLARINRFSGTSDELAFLGVHRWRLRVSIIPEALIAADIQPRQNQTSHKDRNRIESNSPFINSRVWLQLHWQDISWKEKYDLQRTPWGNCEIWSSGCFSATDPFVVSSFMYYPAIWLSSS